MSEYLWKQMNERKFSSCTRKTGNLEREQSNKDGSREVDGTGARWKQTNCTRGSWALKEFVDGAKTPNLRLGAILSATLFE